MCWMDRRMDAQTPRRVARGSSLTGVGRAVGGQEKHLSLQRDREPLAEPSPAKARGHECLGAAAGGSAQLPRPHLRPPPAPESPWRLSSQPRAQPSSFLPHTQQLRPPLSRTPPSGRGRNHHRGCRAPVMLIQSQLFVPKWGQGGLTVQWRGWCVPRTPGFASAEAQQAKLGQRTPLQACAGLPLPGDPP